VTEDELGHVAIAIYSDVVTFEIGFEVEGGGFSIPRETAIKFAKAILSSYGERVDERYH
jgi:hypothetical protein